MSQKRNLQSWLEKPRPVLIIALVCCLVVAVGALAGLVLWLSPVSTTTQYGQSPMVMRSMDVATEAFQLKGAGEFAPDAQRERIIYNGNIEVEVGDVDYVYGQVLEFATSVQGMISETSRWVANQDQNFYRIVVRVPSPHFNATLATFSELGKVTRQSVTGQDVTQEYYDLEARLSTKVKQEERYLEILQQAVTVEDVLQVERELERIRVDIESMQGTLRYYQDRTDLATVTVTLREPERPSLLLPTADVVGAFLGSVRGLLLFAASITPWLLGLAVFALLAKVILFRRKG